MNLVGPGSCSCTFSIPGKLGTYLGRMRDAMIYVEVETLGKIFQQSISGSSLNRESNTSKEESSSGSFWFLYPIQSWDLVVFKSLSNPVPFQPGTMSCIN